MQQESTWEDIVLIAELYRQGILSKKELTKEAISIFETCVQSQETFSKQFWKTLITPDVLDIVREVVLEELRSNTPSSTLDDSSTKNGLSSPSAPTTTESTNTKTEET